MKIKNLGVILLGVVICLPALWPFFQPKFFHLHDWTHVARLVEMDQALKDGHFPVRWSRNLGYGYGMPQFNFYAPLPYYVAELIHLMGFSPLVSIKLLVMVNFLVSFMVMYYLAESRWGKWAGVVAGTAFIYAPYRAVDTYVRGSFGELTAITFIAVVIFCLSRWIQKPSREQFAWTALAVGGLILSHNLVAFLALPLLVIVAFSGVWLFQRRLRIVILTGLMFGLGIGVAAFYAIPALREKSATQVDVLTTGFSDYHQHFLYLRQFFQNTWGYGGSISGPEDNISFSLGLIQVVLTIIGGLSLLYFRKKTDPVSKFIIIISGAVVVISMLMSTFKAQWFWDLLPIMKYVQFPWRYLSIIIVFLSLMTGAAVHWLPGKSGWYTGLVIIFIITSIIWLNMGYFRPEAYLDNNDSLYYTDPVRIQKEMSGIIPDFLPKQAEAKNVTPPLYRFTFNPSVETVRIMVDRTQEFYLNAKLSQPTTFSANIYYFPGWTMYLNGQEKPLTEISSSGMMNLSINETGEVAISGKFQETPLRAVANMVSVGSLFICGYLLIKGKNNYD